MNYHKLPNILGGIALLGAALAGTGHAAPPPTKRPQASRKATPAPPAPVIVITAMDDESRRAEMRLTQFIRALQEGRRESAVRLLSTRVNAKARQALIRKEWLTPNAKRQGDFQQILFWRDLQIHTTAIFRDTRRLSVGPRKIPFSLKRSRTRPPTGVLEVRMRKEFGKWWVEMQP